MKIAFFVLWLMMLTPLTAVIAVDNLAVTPGAAAYPMPNWLSAHTGRSPVASVRSGAVDTHRTYCMIS